MNTFISPPFRACFTHNLFKASRAVPDAKEEYSVVALFTEPTMETQQWKDMITALSGVGKKKWGDDWGKDLIDKMKKKDKFCIKDAEDKSKWAEFEPGRKYMNLRRKAEDGRPQIIDMQGNPIHEEGDILYSGVICRAGIRFYGWDNAGGVGMSCQLDHVQLMKTGTPRLDNHQDAAEVFGEAPDMSDDVNAVLKDMGITETSSSDDDII